jgi:WhiB family redox-sensing transcriptional regulator
MSIAPTAAVAPTDGQWVSDWPALGRCAGTDPDALFVQGKAQRAAKAVCKGCPVIAECLAEALDSRMEFGVWGGKTERERRALLRQNPHVSSWWGLFGEARARQVS